MARTDPLIAGAYEIDPARPLVGAGGGLDAYAAIERRGGRHGFMAVQVRDGEAPRPQPLNALPGATIAGVMTPLGSGVGRDAIGRQAQFVICRAPPGPPLAASLGDTAAVRPWTEAELLACVVRPVAAALAELEGRRVTHRGIRPDNVFQPERGQPVVLGCAWAGPPASLQPSVYEPVSSAACLPAGRGEGSVADDVYALGVLLVTLTVGAQPLAGMEAAEVVARKVELGSFAALTQRIRLPPMIGDLVRGMLAEDPDHRPSPMLLADPVAARSRRVAARPQRRAQRPFGVGPVEVWDARGLAHTLTVRPDEGARALRAGGADRWLRRVLGDPTLGQAVDEAVRARDGDSGLDEQSADALMVMRAVAALNPLTPPCWRGLVFSADALGCVLAAATPEQDVVLRGMIEAEALAVWASARPDRGDPVLVRLDARQHRMVVRTRGWAGGIAKLRYVLNPLLPCRSPLLRGAVVCRLSELLPALEVVAGHPDRPALPIDAEIAAFVAAKLEGRLESEFAAMAFPARQGAAEMAQMRVLAVLQDLTPAIHLPALGGWMEAACAEATKAWRSRARQEQARAELARHAAAGRLYSMLGVLANPAAQAQDAQEADAARVKLQDLDAQIAAAEAGRQQARLTSRHQAHEIAAACGTIAAVASLVMALVL